MKRSRFSPSSWWVALLLTACAPAVGYERGVTPAERDRLHADAPPPEPDPAADYITQTKRAVIEAPPEAVLQWIVDVPLQDVLVGGPGISPVVGTDLLTERWGAPGGRRRVVLEDGTTALEQMLSYEKGVEFEYLVWNFSNQARFATDYAVASFRVQPVGDATALEWEYNFQSKGAGTRLALKRFVHKSYGGMMETTMERIAEMAEREIGALDRS